MTLEKGIGARLGGGLVALGGRVGGQGREVRDLFGLGLGRCHFGVGEPIDAVERGLDLDFHRLNPIDRGVKSSLVPLSSHLDPAPADIASEQREQDSEPDCDQEAAEQEWNVHDESSLHDRYRKGPEDLEHFLENTRPAYWRDRLVG